MVDLKTQYDKIKPEIDKAIQQVIDSAAFIKGPQIKQFEKELAYDLNINHVIGCGNGTDALQISLMALDLKQGDEVITPDFTFISTVEVIALLGLKPILVDVDPYTFNIQPEAIKKAITKKTKAIIPVHLFGQCANMDEIIKIAHENNLYIIEDAAQATGAEYITNDKKTKKAGAIGNIGCTSFFPSKNLACYGDGGAIFTNNNFLAEKIRTIANHGMKTKYYNDLIGVNSRLDTIQAAILTVKLKYLDGYNKARQAVANFYDKELIDIEGVHIPARASYSSHVFHQYTIRLDGINRDNFKNFLQLKGIPSMIYYPVPLHRQKAFTYLGYQDKDFPVTEKLCKSVLSLPMHTELETSQLEYIIHCVKEFIRKET